ERSPNYNLKMQNVSVNQTTTRNAGQSILSFSAGVVGNAIALCILYWHIVKSKSRNITVFYILVSGLAWTELAGLLLISIPVFYCYTLNTTIEGLSKGTCQYVGLIMSFIGLCAMFILLVMALECWLSIGHPYFHQRHVTKEKVMLVFPVIYTISILFCCMPLFQFGSYKQYKPGTWCYIGMNPAEDKDKAFSVLYASVMALVILTIVLCNISVVLTLAKMYKRARLQNVLSTSMEKTPEQTSISSKSHADEIDNIILLVLMTPIFVFCSLPLTVSKISHLVIYRINAIMKLVRMLSIILNQLKEVFLFFLIHPFSKT
uniref:Thromboxane A2 receptor n=1 Tax=Erpetoichthys calabaricus TaxID=27687 RepID=A0A8C4SPM8_ERPCA